MKKSAVFLDRDGTISREIGYVNHEDNYELLPNTAKGIKILNQKNIPVVVVTNQAGVARGYFTEDLIKVVHAKMEKLLSDEGAFVDKIYYCPHHPQAGKPPYRVECQCRKPKTLMLEMAEKELNLDLSLSYMIGDKISDVEFAHSAGMKGIMVLTGYGLGEYTYQKDSWKVSPDFIANDLYDAVVWIVKDMENR
jgi:D-glycero-D-manno-heptose 1,7-bisphosphate phosphatase